MFNYQKIFLMNGKNPLFYVSKTKKLIEETAAFMVPTIKTQKYNAKYKFNKSIFYQNTTKEENKKDINITSLNLFDEKKLYKITSKVIDEYEQLKKEGHTCVYLLESYPPQLVWCTEKVCSGKTK